MHETMRVGEGGGALVLTPGLAEAPTLDRLCSHFVLTLALRQPASFNPRRDWSSLLSLVGRHLVWPPAVLRRLRGYLQRRCSDNPLWREHAALDDAVFLERHGLWRGPYEDGTLFYYFDEFVKDSPKDLSTLLTTTAEWLARSLQAPAGAAGALPGAREPTLVERNIDALARLLQLNPAERALLLYGTLARYQRDLRGLLVEFKVTSAHQAYAAIAQVAGVDAREVAEALRAGSRLERIGMVENLISEHNITDLADLMKVSDQLPPVLMREYRDTDELMAVFTRPAARSTLGPADFEHLAEDVALITRLLQQAVAQQAEGVNLLLYGPPGTGKTELARVCAQAAGLTLYEVESADREGHSLSGRDRYRSLQISQVFLKGSPRVALLFDEVEDVFPPISADAAQALARQEAGHAPAAGQVGGKAWVNQILESNRVPVIWVTNRIEQIDPAFRRRFQYHLQLQSPPPGAREALLRRALAGHPVREAFVQRLAERRGLTPAQIRTALRFATLVSAEAVGAGLPSGQPAGQSAGQSAAGAAAADEAACAAFEALVERQLGHADRALGRVTPGAGPRRVVTQYALDLLNLDSRYPVARIVESLRQRGHGTLCLHGLPGTGKTALAEHIAQALGRPLLIRLASDLASKYVGETEQAMARMFAEAETEQAVLLLDEADSFLRSRQRAERAYEVTEVNQMLAGMERFAGIFICTTNLYEQIDEAALRRFTFKIRFDALQPAQRERMFVAEALAGRADALTAEQAQRLAALALLTPGDFAAVRRQVELLGEAMTPDEFLSQLEGEHRQKPQVRERRGLGFLHGAVH